MGGPTGTPGRRWLTAAALVGLVHAAFSAYWAFGGRWLLDTVGRWAVTLVRDHPLGSSLGLGAIALVKTAGALVPLVVESRRGRWWSFWRRVEWAGAVGLIVYGALNVVVAWLVLGGVIEAAGGYNRPAEWGHAALWDPLFLAWGLLLAAGLRATRRARPAP